MSETVNPLPSAHTSSVASMTGTPNVVSVNRIRSEDCRAVKLLVMMVPAGRPVMTGLASVAADLNMHWSA